MVQWLTHWTVKIYDRGTIPAPDFPFRVALPVHPAENGYRDLPWKLNAAERSADHIASLCAEIWKRWTANTHCRDMSTWTCPSGAAKFFLYVIVLRNHYRRCDNQF